VLGRDAPSAGGISRLERIDAAMHLKPTKPRRCSRFASLRSFASKLKSSWSREKPSPASCSYKARQDELGELEAAYRDAVQRRAKLEATERARMPATKVLEAASASAQPWRPFYWRDTAFSIGGSLVLALLAMWLVELFNRAGPQPAVLLIQPQAGGALPLQMMTPQMLSARRTAMPLEAVEPTLLPRQPKLPRELRPDEVAALVRAADPGSRLAILLFLSSASPEEALKLRRSDVDLARGAIRVGDGREITLCDALQRCLDVGSAPGSEFILGAPGGPATRDSLDAQILCAAHDAAIEDPTRVNAECLRHTYMAFRVRQGIRFADPTHVVGDLPVEIVGAYSALSPPGTRLAGAAIEVLHPALR
jgi:succinoglycan biosynthesis transport protein ExoP